MYIIRVQPAKSVPAMIPKKTILTIEPPGKTMVLCSMLPYSIVVESTSASGVFTACWLLSVAVVCGVCGGLCVHFCAVAELFT